MKQICLLNLPLGSSNWNKVTGWNHKVGRAFGCDQGSQMWKSDRVGYFLQQFWNFVHVIGAFLAHTQVILLDSGGNCVKDNIAWISLPFIYFLRKIRSWLCRWKKLCTIILIHFLRKSMWHKCIRCRFTFKTLAALIRKTRKYVFLPFYGCL